MRYRFVECAPWGKFNVNRQEMRAVSDSSWHTEESPDICLHIEIERQGSEGLHMGAWDLWLLKENEDDT